MPAPTAARLNSPINFPPHITLSIGGELVELVEGQAKAATLTLTTGKDFPVAVYDNSKPTQVDLPDFYSKDFGKCWEAQGKTGKIAVARNLEEISITTRDAVGCAAFQLGNFGSSLATVELPYKSHDSSRPHFCVLEEGESARCENKDVFYATSPSSEWTSVTRMAVLGNKVYWLLVDARPPDKAGDEWTIDYRKPKVTVYPLFEQFAGSSSVWDNYELVSGVQVQAGDEIKVVVPAKTVGIDLRNSFREDIDNCDTLKRGSVAKSSFEQGVNYFANNWGVGCDYYSAKELSTANSYVLRFQGVNYTGRPPKLYLTNNASGREDLAVIGKTSKFDDSYSLLAWPLLYANDYGVRLENRSFASYDTINSVGVVQAYQIPTDWLSSIRIDSGQTEIANSLVVSNVAKVGTYKYLATVSGSGMLVLSQSFDPGWVAFANGKVLAHTRVNTWANGWMVPEGTTSVTMVFWPQYLEFAGLGLLVIGSIWLFLPFRGSKHRVLTN